MGDHDSYSDKPIERSVAVELSGQKLRRRRISLGLRLNESNGIYVEG